MTLDAALSRALAWLQELSWLGRGLLGLALLLALGNLLLWTAQERAAAGAASLAERHNAGRSALQVLMSADGAAQQLLEEEQRHNEQRDALLAPFLTLEGRAPASVAIDAAAQTGAILTSLQVSARSRVTLADQPFDTVDVSVALRSPPALVVDFLEAMEAIAQERLFGQGPDVKLSPEGWQASFGYRVYHRVPKPPLP